MQEKNYYELLGVPRRASSDKIKEAYLALSELYSPSSDFYSEILESAVNEEQEALFKIITAAYNTLIDPKARELYDKQLPPEISGWREQDCLDRIDLKATSSMAYGIFGSGPKAPTSSFESVKPGRPESVAEIIHVGKPSIVRRLLSLIGL